MANPASSKDGEWGPHKELLKTLYLTEDMPKKDIRTLMKEKYAFDKR
jgi:DNA-dependent RNA polymerase auxiliary subunit epsilon